MIKAKFYSFLFCSAIALAFSSCVQKRFIHNAAPAIQPMFKEKGEGFATAYYHTNGGSKATVNDGNLANSSSNGVNFQGGYSLSNHFALVGAVNYMNQKNAYYDWYSNDPFDTSKVSARRTEFTLAGDYFFTNKEKTTGFHLLGGVTFGKLKMSDHGRDGGVDYNRYFNSNSFFAFLQPGIVLYKNDNSGFGVFTKLSYVSYHNINSSYTPQELARLRLDTIPAFYTGDIGFKFALGFKDFPVTLDGQMGYTYLYSGNNRIKRGTMAIGASYHFSRNTKKKK